MDLSKVLTSASQRKLNCALCHCYLSHFPIRVLKSGKNICGRCTSTETNLSNVVFESACHWLKFPCIYEEEGCSETLFPQDVPSHEEACSFRLKCPMVTTDCGWRGHRSKMLQHCQSQHPDTFLTNSEFDLDLEHSHESQHFLEYQEVLLLVNRKYDAESRLLRFFLQNLTGEKHCICNLTFTTDQKTFQLEYTTRRTPTEIVFDTSENVAVLKPVGESLVQEVLNEELLSTLKCSECSQFALPPVYEIAQTVRCSECRDTAPNSDYIRNFSLDKIAGMLNYPCKFRKNGCGFVARPGVMKNHVSTCELREYRCPFRKSRLCGWKGMENCLQKHIKQIHKEYFYTLKDAGLKFVLTLPNRFETIKDIRIISGANFLFKFKFMITSRQFCCATKLLGKSKGTFKYELKFHGCDENNYLVIEKLSRFLIGASGYDSWYINYDEVKKFEGNGVFRVTLKIVE